MTPRGRGSEPKPGTGRRSSERYRRLRHPRGAMFAKLKKKIAEEAAVAPRAGGAARMPRSISKESITSVGADSGDDFVSSAPAAVCFLLQPVCRGFGGREF